MPRSWRRALACGVASVVILAVVLGVGYLLLRLVPDWLDQSSGLDPNEAALERGRIRTAGLVFIGGVVAVAGAVFAGLTFLLSRRGQGTERFNKAIELIGHKNKSVRLGGIEALGQLATDDPGRHHRAALEVLLAYVREHSPWAPGSSSGSGAAVTAVPDASVDVKAAMAVLARRTTAHDPERLLIDLSNTNLKGIEAQGIHLRGALLSGTQLQDADLKRASLHGAAFVNADLAGAELDDATIDSKTSFVKANLVGASLGTTSGVYEADFTNAVHGDTVWPYGVAPEGVISPP